MIRGVGNTRPGAPESVGIIVPVFQGEQTLEALLAEIEPLTRPTLTPQGHLVRIIEVILVNDGAKDRSDRVMTALASRHPFVRLVWLSRNFGQHAALLAGMAQSTAEWLATIDEDGQHDPRDIGALLDQARIQRALLVYAKPTNRPPHGRLRNWCSDATKWIAGSILCGHRLRWFHSFRLLRGDIGRALASACTTHVYLDVALSWLVSEPAICPLRMRAEYGRPSGHSMRSLLSHFWRLVLASGTKPLRGIALLGILSLVFSTLVAAFALWTRVVRRDPVPPWAAIMIVMGLSSGVLLFSQAVIAEYLGLALTRLMGKPLFMTLPHPTRSIPLPAGAPAEEAEPAEAGTASTTAASP